MGAALVVGLTACGDQPTANRDFYAVATHSSFYGSVHMSPSPELTPVLHQVLSGHLVGASGIPLAGSLFYEDCETLMPTPNKLSGQTVCTATVKTGTNTYVARGSGQPMAGGVHGAYYGMLGSLGPGGGIGPGSAVMWILPAGAGTTPIHMKISFRLWGSAPVTFS